MPAILSKRHLPTGDLPAALDYVRSLVEPLSTDAFGHKEETARQRLRNRDEDDWPILAAALSLGCDIWTEDTDFFGVGVAVWTSDRVELYLNTATAKRASAEDLQSALPS